MTTYKGAVPQVMEQPLCAFVLTVLLDTFQNLQNFRIFLILGEDNMTRFTIH